ncbi:hypothetical protein D3C85_1617910 [compost metagenome]
MPARILAVSLSEVTTLGCETTSPLPVDSIADSCRSRITLSVTKPTPKPEVLANAPKSTKGVGDPSSFTGRVQLPANGPQVNSSLSSMPILPSLP